jgi:general secretion pathway protein K
MKVHFTSHRRQEQGSALMLVFALIAMLSYLVFTTMRVVMNDIEFSIANKKGFRCRCLAESGINMAMNPVVKRTDTALLNQSFGEDGYESFSVKLRGEGGRLNINSLLNATDPDKELLKRLFEAWGVTDEAQRDLLVDHLIDWTDQDDEELAHGRESENYEKAGMTGYPFNRFFYNLDELLLVPGFDTVASLKPNWRDYFTIYSQGRLDLNEAPADLLAIVCDTTPESAQQFIETRWGPDKIEDTEDDYRYQSVEEALALLDVGNGPYANDAEFEERTAQRLSVNDTTTRIESTGTVGDFRRRIIMVVRNRQQPQILTREEIPLF